MATGVQTPQSNPVRLDVRQMSSRPRTVKINGVEYRVTVYRSRADGSEENVTSECRDLKAVTEAVIGIASHLVGQAHTLQKVSTTLNGIPRDLRTMQASGEGVTFNSTNVTFLDTAGVQQEEEFFGNSPAATERVVKNHLRKVGRAFCARATPLPNIPAIEVDSSGRCLDMSLAHQILGKSNLEITRESLEGVATYLRRQVEAQLRTPARDGDEGFINNLCESIAAIPNMSAEEPVIALVRGDRRDLTPENKTTLRTFYAEYITRPPMNNYLDSAFLYVLPSIPVDAPHQAAFPRGYQCAVLQEGVLRPYQYPNDAPLTKSDTLYVLYDGTIHYKAVDTVAAAAYIDALLLNRLYEAEDDAAVQMALAVIQAEHPAAYKALARMVCQYDFTEWAANQAAAPQPPDTTDPERYGRERLANINPQELQRLLHNRVALSRANVEAIMSAPPPAA